MIAAKILETLQASSLSLATAESCTGGQVASALTANPGASKSFLGSVICYSNASKEKLLGVKSETLKDHGAVSEEVAEQLALGAQQVFGSDYAISTTGIAGPGGGSETKPVGMVCFGLASPNYLRTTTKQFGDLGRSQIQKKATQFALEWLLSDIELAN